MYYAPFSSNSCLFVDGFILFRTYRFGSFVKQGWCLGNALDGPIHGLKNSFGSFGRSTRCAHANADLLFDMGGGPWQGWIVHGKSRRSRSRSRSGHDEDEDEGIG